MSQSEKNRCFPSPHTTGKAIGKGSQCDGFEYFAVSTTYWCVLRRQSMGCSGLL